MLNIKKKYVEDENGQPIAVQIDIETFKKMENLLEDYALGRLLEEDTEQEYLSVEEAKSHYRSLTQDKH